MKHLFLGIGHDKPIKFLKAPNEKDFDDTDKIVTLDINPECKPDIIWDLNNHPLPFKNKEFDVIWAKEILEHIGTLGDVDSFFKEFNEYFRILKPNGKLIATVPSWDSMWALGDPSHTRIINAGTLVFLSQDEYKKQLGKTPMSDYRSLLGKTNFKTKYSQKHDQSFIFVLQAIKKSSLGGGAKYKFEVNNKRNK